MINRVVLVGRLTRDPEINEGSSLVARFSIAVDRIRGPEPVTDFFTIV
ncbi:MAG: single-stranded DNA-binding protein, partial [Bacillales bacterium]|nr:single-stranded DNA-binding protein [Bacillales bacterium]